MKGNPPKSARHTIEYLDITESSRHRISMENFRLDPDNFRSFQEEVLERVKSMFTEIRNTANKVELARRSVTNM